MLDLWVIYQEPDDFSSLMPFVARKFHGEDGTLEFLFAGTLEELRAQLPPHLACLARDPNDDPKIVEVWL